MNKNKTQKMQNSVPTFENENKNSKFYLELN